MSGKRTDYLSWREYFMNVAKITALRSKDPETQVGAVIVKNNKIVSTGYNGFPNGISDDELPWTKGSNDNLENKHLYVVHAELNAILNATTSCKGGEMYCTLFCCNGCAAAIIQSGIKKVFYNEDPNLSKDKYKASIIMFKLAGIDIEKLKA